MHDITNMNTQILGGGKDDDGEITLDIDESNGPTEFLVGSHRRRLAHPDDEPDDRRRATIVAPAGAAIIFDYRTWHRGLPNMSVRDRHVLYLVAARPWFADRNVAHERAARASRSSFARLLRGAPVL